MDIATAIANQAHILMRLITDIDDFAPDEGAVEVLLYAFEKWGSIETAIIFPVLERYVEESEPIVDAALKRLDMLAGLQDSIHLYEGADAPFSELANKYIAAVKYHLIVDVQDIAPLTMQVPPAANAAAAERMQHYQSEFDD